MTDTAFSMVVKKSTVCWNRRHNYDKTQGENSGTIIILEEK
ncbi:hypothetical protein SUBVAR_05653 [Subdoligranulum variabile DSM 15176]|uniref:Uncharacterized protein n=1 Tax=Subdoligranulum variabile DSM 15176 TaxID=411471 RepID=D1PMT9_9FIRM|nr:hypothetical protein SUBVAR_05653 [Subdoligranulum variabile DSM 15176]